MNGDGALSPAAIALNRFGLGATPGAPPPDPRAWLHAQLARYEPLPPAWAALPDAAPLVAAYQAERRAMREAAPPQAAASAVRTPMQVFGERARGLYRQAVQARLQAALATDAPFVERLVHFWANHFCVSADSQVLTAWAGAFERDAIRPHVLGRFEDLLLAVERHPAMLVYLNQNASIGPDSAAARRAAQHMPERRRGLNENLAREILELHTLGVRTGYTQDDVTEFARALTGWGVAGAADDAPGSFLFRPGQHEPGERRLLGRRYDQPGEAQAHAVLADLARAPATATHVATKLARHFAGDTPPPRLVARLAEAFVRSDGDLPTLYRTLIDSPEPWAAKPLKFKTPWEWAVSALRGLGRREPGAMPVAGALQQLGQPVWKPGSPAGWDDTAPSWLAPDALLRRVEFAQRLAMPVGDRLDARALAPQLLPGALAPETAGQIARAESPAGALALLLVSPDFLRR